MRPAFSILFFTTLSGAGYGLWLLLGLGIALGLPVGNAKFILLLILAIGFALTTIGLLCSVAHLGQPQRAWRAVSQWRSSWLSREGIAALLCMLVAAALAAAIACDLSTSAVRVGGSALAVCALLVVFCTARIYTSMPTIDAWHNRLVLPVYIALALLSGGLWLWTLAVFSAEDSSTRVFVSTPALIAWAAFIVVAAACKAVYWRHIDRSHGRESTGSATGLDRFGDVRSFEHPHTEANYLTHEMGFVVARKHAARLRIGVLWLAFGVPFLLLGCAAFAPASAILAAPLALLSATLGVFVERWLFFAEARHVVMLYYGAHSTR